MSSVRSAKQRGLLADRVQSLGPADFRRLPLPTARTTAARTLDFFVSATQAPWVEGFSFSARDGVPATTWAYEAPSRVSFGYLRA